MNRRQFLSTGLAGALASPAFPGQDPAPDRLRDHFPRLGTQVHLDAAGGTPLCRAAERGMRAYFDLWSLGPGEGRAAAMAARVDEARARFARRIGAAPEEIALVPSTKAGEQVVLDGLEGLRRGQRVVTNAFHFAGSLHNLLGLRAAGALDVHVVRAHGWDLSLERMADAIDAHTGLVCVTHVSNVNGRVEPLAELCALAHERGALVYADVIQSVGAVPLDVAGTGVDFAACSTYKWLLGMHGAGFLYVRRALQGSVLSDRMVPGHARHDHAPWTTAPVDPERDFLLQPRDDARRYQPGHVNYLGYCALAESLAFLDGIDETRLHGHGLDLTRVLRAALDEGKYPCLSPHLGLSPIVAFGAPGAARLEEPLRRAGIAIKLEQDRVRVSPAFYNERADVERLAEVLNSGH